MEKARNLVIRQHKKEEEKRAYLSLTAFENGEKIGSSVPDP
jgi:hypothetical protein